MSGHGEQRGRVRRGLTGLIVAAGLVGVVGAAPALAATGSIGGTVTATVGGAPVGSYEVELHNVAGSLIESTCTAADGTYTLGGLATGSYEVRFSGDPGPCGAQGDYAAEWWNDHYSRTFADPVAVTDGQDTGAVNASLEAGSHIQGTVTADATALALDHVTIQVLDFTGVNVLKTVCTSATGFYSAGPFSAGIYVVKFDPDGSCGDAGDYAVQYYDESPTLVTADPVNLSPGQTLGGIDGSLVAAASPATLTVTRTGTGSGSVSSIPGAIACPDTCSATFPAGTPVTLTATPANGSTFTGWTGGGCSGTGDCTVTMNADTSVSAAFADVPDPPPVPRTLTVEKAGAGSGTVTSAPAGISCPGTCSDSVDSGTSVKLTATPASGSTFAGRSGSGCSGTGDCTLTMDADRSVTATFATAAAGGNTPPPSTNPPPGGGSTPPPGSGPPPSGSTPPPSGSTPPPSGSAARRPTCRLAVKSARVIKPGRLTLSFTCDQAASLSLSGTVTERIAKTKRTKRFRVKSVRASATAGRAGTVTIRLPAAALRGLRTHKRSASFTLLAQNANGQAKATAKVARLRG